ncbi:PKD domain-containing protein [Nocardioides sp. Y6]|uniref:PKD domain-containing protein n=1 Tax=Nocardioides malaquae TaxID=2773426 RepID=A0ABR9RQX9_9ACTN|nr:PKD domain-containing protein [Nocardioides malaquae]MBE7323976.1 PKD domain-containing protein [Nocardioides malaquae]
MSSFKRAVALGVALLVPGVVTPVASASLTAEPAGRAAVQAIDAAVLGTSPETAAGSCWEIKQARSSARNGSYWLLTPSMPAPAQFYCDQTTDGGGWVLIGKGRDGWTTEYAGKGNAAALQSPDTVPMSSVTHQLPSTTVDQLLDGGRPDALSEGVRVRRARNTGGTQWQEARFTFADKSRWSWTFGAEHRIATWKFDTLPGWGGTSESFGTGQSYSRMVNTTDSDKKYRVGFGYGSWVRGSTSASSYMWSATRTGPALPYAQVYLRPRITSTDPDFQRIGDNGAPARPNRPGLNSNALANPWGVSGLQGSTTTEGNVEVQAFTESNGRMYVGGNFRYVQRDATGTGRVEQPFLAAFDIATGEWDPSFRPVLNEQVRALATLPDGSVVAAGAFSRANGQPATAVVALDPATGATRSSWSLTVENRASGGVLNIRTLDVAGNHLYLGGAFTHLAGGTAPSTVTYSRGAARVDLATGTPDRNWNPDFNGSVIDLDGSDDGARVYAAGYFSTSKGVTAPRVASVTTAPGAGLDGPAWRPTWSNRDDNYQQAVQQVGNRVFAGGAQHSLFGFDTGSFSRISSNIMKKGGDVQAAVTDGDLLYASCHCAQWTYSGATTWETLNSGWHQADTIKWLGVWDPATGEYLPEFVPNLSMRLGSGPWALEVDSTGTLWAGGDILTARTGKGQVFAGGFARFQRTDSTAPGAPGNFRVDQETASTVTLRWQPTPDPSGVTYQLLRDDRPVATLPGGTTTVTVPRVDGERYFVRATDNRGNVGPSTPVLTIGGPPVNQPPVAAFSATVADRTVTLDGTGSSDDRGITSWSWDLGDGTTRTGASVTHTYAQHGAYEVTLTVTDAAGLTSTTTRTLRTETTQDPQVIPAGSTWKWYYRPAAPPAQWTATTFDDSGWESGAGHLGWGAPEVVTSLDLYEDPTTRPVTAYFRRTFHLGNLDGVRSLRIQAVANDGAVVHVNGVEVGRQNMRDGAVTHTTYAPTARRHAVASAAPLVVDVPVSLLVEGANVVSVDTHVNYRRTPDLTFDLSALLVSD